MERKVAGDDRDVVDRHDVHGVEHRDRDGGDAADRARPRGVRRRVAARVDGHIRVCRRGRVSPRVRPALARALDDPVRDPDAQARERRGAGGCGCGTTCDGPSPSHCFQPR